MGAARRDQPLGEGGSWWVDERLVYDEEHEVFSLAYDGVFAFGPEYANWEEPERRGFEE